MEIKRMQLVFLWSGTPKTKSCVPKAGQDKIKWTYNLTNGDVLSQMRTQGSS